MKSRVVRAALSGKYKVFFSQHGEDVVIFGQFPRGFAGYYLDIGAFHPFKFSNTALLWLGGWQGMNIDANRKSVAAFDKHRPQDRNLWGAVVPSAMAAAGATVRFSQDETAYNLSGRVVSGGPGTDVPALTLDDVAQTLGGRPVDFMNIDIEGLDEQVVVEPAFARIAPYLLAIEQFADAVDDVLTRPSTAHLRALGYTLIGRIGITSLSRKGERRR